MLQLILILDSIHDRVVSRGVGVTRNGPCNDSICKHTSNVIASDNLCGDFRALSLAGEL